MITYPRRGEVWDAALDPVVGHEQGGTRPVLVLSTDQLNASRAEIVTILPITSKPRAVRTRVPVQPPEGGLTTTSYVMCEQVRTVSVAPLVRRRGALRAPTLESVEDIVRTLLGL